MEKLECSKICGCMPNSQMGADDVR